MELRPDYPVETKRTNLRPLAATDLDDLLAYRSLEQVCRFVPFHPMNAVDVRARLTGPWSRRHLDEEGQALTLGVEQRSTRRVIGDVLLAFHSEEHQSGEIGYVFHPDVAGRGYATEAVEALLTLAFEGLGLRRVVARVDARNAPSIALARRLGMREEAHLVENEWFKGEWTDEIDFALLAREWRTNA